ncbi:hypothetical protein M0805_004671 [Coniferiporia weirii]|nr:hypothetical protein M0805_004671 [Coniferiporia weirii]
MGRGFLPFRVGHAGAVKNYISMTKRDSCSTGGFIESPTSGQQVDTSKPVTFAWDSSCLNITAADIYLYAPYQESTLIQMFQDVDFSLGSYNTTLKPKWWNSTSSVNLQFNIVETGTPAFLATLPAGPIWSANYNASDAGSMDAGDIGTVSSSDSNVTQVNNLNTKGSSGLSKGAVAAAVLVPLIVIGLALTAYIKYTRTREATKRKRWSEAVDKRMSVMSVDWRSMSVKGAEAAIRASMADPNRNSVWSGSGTPGIGVPRPSSTFAMEGAQSEGDIAQPEMAQIRRPGVGLRGPMASATGGAARVSRVSFAADTRFSRASVGDGLSSRGRPSVDSRRTGVPSRAFHSAYIPPLPIPSHISQYVPEAETSTGSDSEENSSGLVSPVQREGPHDLSVDEIHARMSGMRSDNASHPSLDEVMPALSMMRMANGSQAEFLFERSEEPAPLHVETTVPALPPSVVSPVSNVITMPPPPAEVMSPDEMMRAYAERRRAGGGAMISPPGTPSPITFPMPIASAMPVTSPSAMRTLYSPSVATFRNGPGAETTMGATAGFSGPVSVVPVGSNNPFRKSMARQSAAMPYEDEDAYFGTAE